MHRTDAQFRLKELGNVIPEKKKNLKKAQQDVSSKASEISRLEYEQMEITTSLGVVKNDIRVSDHALVRYMEREYSFDFERYRCEILTPIVKQAIQAGATGVKVGNINFRVSNNTIVTAI